MNYVYLSFVSFIFLSLSNFVYGGENTYYQNESISSWCADTNYTFGCGNYISIIDTKKNNVSESNASANDVVDQELPYESISFESPKKFIKTLKDILKNEIPKDKIDFTLEPFNASDTGFNYKNIKTLKKALPLGSEEIIRSVKELNIEERSELKKSLQIEIYHTALSRASGESLNEVKKSSSMGKIGLGLLGVGGAIAAGGSSDKPAALPSLSISSSTSAIAESSGTSTVTVTLSKAVGVDIEVTIAYSSTASVDVDFSSQSTVSILKGETSATFTVTAIDDSVYEGDETSVVTISSIDNSGVNISSSNSVTLTITEDEPVPTVSLESSSNSIAEESGNSITFTASIDQVASVDLSVTISTTVNSRSRAYTANLPTSISITIPAGSLSGTATFTPTDNNSYDGTTNVSFAVSSVVGSGAVGNTISIHSSAAEEFIGIVEAESAPTVSLNASSTSVAEDGSVITLTATLTGSTYTDTTVVLGGSGTATNTSDYTIANITIAAGETSGTASFTPIEDNLYEGVTEKAIVSISSVSGGGATESGDQSVTITITDADSAPTVTLTSNVTTVAEDGGTGTLTATLSIATTADVTVELGAAGTATSGTDYTSGVTSTITISAGSLTGTASGASIADDIYEGDETVIVSISSVSGGGATENGTQSLTVTITDAESAPTVNLSSSSASVTEDGSAITLTATLSNKADEAVTVPITTSGTATEGTDYATISDITIAAGATTGTASITPTDDSVSEGIETLVVSLGTLSGADATAGSTSSISLNLVDDDVPNITLTSSASSIAENSSSSLTLTATTSMVATEDIVVTLGAAGTATSGTDYTALPTTVTITAGATTATTSFTPKDDTLYDAASNETAIISITNVSGGNALESGDQSVTLTITDNESAPTVTLTSNVTTVAENGGTGTVKATLSVATYADVIVELGGAGTATSGTDYTSGVTSTITISAGSLTGTASGASIADDIYEGDETVIVSISSVSGGGATESGDQSVTITITDADSAPTVTLTSNVTTVAEDGGTGTLTATLSIATTADVTVELGAAGTATSGTDYTSGVTSTITISAGSLTGTASGASIADDIYEGDETVIVSISSVSGGGATENGTQSLTVTITDAESAPTVNLSSSSASVTEDGSAITLTATLSNKADEAVTVPITTSGTATEGTDYATISDITIAAGATTGTASITPTDDSVSEGIETLVVSLGTLSGADATAGSTSSISLNLVDDDVPNITLTSSASSIAENSSSSLTLTATTSMVATEDIVVTLGAAGTATSGTDYTALPTTVTITAGATTATTSFTPKDDTLYDAASNETAIISITNVSGGNALESGDQSVTLTITDNESAPTVTLGTSATSVAENGSDLTLTATLSVASYADVIVTLNGSGSSTAGTDYASLSTITISTGNTSGSTTFNPTDDSDYEGSETAIIAITNVAGGSAEESGNQSETITITDSLAAPTVTLTTSASTVSEKASDLTLTATLNRSTYETVTVTLSPSGTSTAGTDYASLSSITISAGNTTGTTTFNPTDDTLFENSETAIIAITGVSGGDATESGTQAVTIAITDMALDSGTQATYSSSLASTYEANTQFKNIEFYNPDKANEPSSWETINLHQAFGYNKFGSGQQIAILDNGFYVTEAGFSSDHNDFDTKTITTFGTFTTPTGTACNSGSHGTCVMSAAGSDGTGVFGVAPSSSFHLTANNTFSGYSDLYLKFAASAADASSAVVLNNSWGHDYNIQLLQAKKTQNSWTSAQAFEYYTDQHSSLYAQSASSIQSYVDALDDFQDHGVVVYALTNDDTFTDADMSAGLAVLFPDLDEAFIAAANVDVYWNGSALSYVLNSGPCGQTASHCLSADGTDITLASHVIGGASTYANTQGTSFSAPTISGAIALLAEHFPNQTPEQWTNRLLASANNVLGFTQTGSVTFGNGVVHGYSYEAGHGMLDIYAALQPITTSSSARNQIYAGSSSLGQSAFSLDSTRANLSRSFGDALEIGLENTNTYFYDALDGGFAVGMNDLAFSLNPVKPSLSVKSELSNLSSVSKKLLHFKDTGWSESSDDRKGFFNASVSSSPSALNNFYLNAGAADLGFAAYSMPTLSGIQGGDGFNLGLNMGEGFLTTSFTQTNLSNNLENEVQSSFITSYQQEISKDLTYSLMFGLADEGSKFLGMTGGGAFDLEGSKSNTSLAGAKVRLGVGEMSSIGFMAAISKSELSEQNQGFVTGIDNVTADTFALSFDTFNVFGNDKLSVSLSQPHRVNSGTMGMQIAGLADSDGNIPYTYHDIGLTPSGRQVDLSIGYSKDISENTTIGARFIHTKEAGHVKSAQDENSIFAGITYKNLNLGGSYVDVSNRVEAEINYTIRW